MHFQNAVGMRMQGSHLVRYAATEATHQHNSSKSESSQIVLHSALITKGSRSLQACGKPGICQMQSALRLDEPIKRLRNRLTPHHPISLGVAKPHLPPPKHPEARTWCPTFHPTQVLQSQSMHCSLQQLWTWEPESYTSISWTSLRASCHQELYPIAS